MYENEETGLRDCRKVMLELFDQIDFSSGGNLYKLTLSVRRNTHRFGVEFLAFKIGFFQQIKGLQEKLKKKKAMIEQQAL